MSDDLISRKVLLDELSSLRIELNGISCRKEFKKTVKEVLDCAKHIVEEQPTAFDKEKVMKELCDAADLKVEDGLWHVELKDALDIVEKGGI